MKRTLATAGILATALLLPAGMAAAAPAQGYVTGNTNLWAGPSEEFPPVRALPEGGQLAIEGCLEGRTWCDVTFEDARGWVPGEDIAYEHEGRRQPVPELADKITLPTVGFSLTGYWDSHYRERPWYRDRDKWASRDGRPAGAPGTASGYITANVNLLSGPSGDYPVVTALPNGAPVIIHGCLDGWAWCDVAFGDIRGWVPGTMLVHEQEGRRMPVAEVGPRIGVPTVTFAVASYWDSHYRTRPWYGERDRWASRYAAPPVAVAAAAPPPPPPPPAPPVPAAVSGPPSPGYVTTNVNLRAGPGTAYPRVTTLPAGAAVTIQGCLEGWTWCDVVYGEMRGWVAGNYVGAEYQGQRVRIPEYGPRLALPIVTFAFTNYWDSYYRERPWYSHRARWARYDYHRAPGFHVGPRYHAPPRHYRVSRPHYRPYVEHRHRKWNRKWDRGHRERRHWDRGHRERRHWDRGPDRRSHPRAEHRRHEQRHWDRGRDRRVERGHRGGGRRGYSGGQTERDAARFNRQRRGPMRGE